jgi:hypothetical protein
MMRIDAAKADFTGMAPKEKQIALSEVFHDAWDGAGGYFATPP